MALTLLFHVAVGIIVPVIAEIEMEFTKYPESVTAPVGDEVTFECAVRVPGERLTWRWKPDNDNWSDWHTINGTSEKENSSSTRLVVQVEEDTVTAFYQCVVWYGAISLVSIPARLAIAKVDLSRNTPERRVITAPVYNTVALHCKEPLSEPAARLNWWKEIKGTKKVLDTPNGVLVIKNATIEDSGTYGCTATNDISERSVDLPERTYLKIQHEGHGGIRFLETDDFVGTIDKDGVLTVPVMPDGALRLWCGLVGTPPPRVTWSKGTDMNFPEQSQYLLVQPFTAEHEGIYSCSSNGIRRSWKAIALQPPHWEGSVGNVNVIEGSEAKIVCGTPHGHPAPKVHWVFNAKLVKSGKGIKATDSELQIERVEKRHAGIVQCFACNSLGCAYDAALLVVVPMQISQDQDYSAETPKTQHIPSQPPKRHNKKNPRKNKAVLIPPSRPNVTRLSDESVMVSWSHDNHGLPIQFFKVQYRDVTSPNTQWQTGNYDIPAHIHSFEIDGLVPDKYYKFRIAAVYSNQDNKLGRSSSKFFLQKGGFQSPRAPVLDKATALSPHSVQINWTWSSHGGVEAEGFYVYYRAVSSAGAYEKVTAGGRARGLALAHLAPDTAYEVKIQAYSAQAPSDFSAILIAKTQRALNTAVTSTEASAKEERGSSPTLVTAGGAAGAALLLVLVVTLLLCRRAKRPTAGKEKGSPEGGANGYLPAKVPITITANPMHGEGGDGGVEMSFLHNNNCGNATSSDDNLPARKNRQYV